MEEKHEGDTMDRDNLIVWQKWVDPFGEDDIETEFDPYVGDYDEEDETKNIDEQKELLKKHKGIKVIATPMGIIPMNENTMSSKLFNFWMGHTNFDITSNIAEIIEKTEGVETLDIFTRYRFRISVGKAFDDSEVMRNINTDVYSELNHG